MQGDPYFLDKIISCYYSLALIVSWSAHGAIERCATIAALPCLAWCLLLILQLNEPWYRKHRATIILSIKAAVLLLPHAPGSLARVQARLQATPTGGFHDVFAAVAGLGLGMQFIGGLLQLRCSVWLVQQLAGLAYVTSLQDNCSTPLLSHPLIAARIAQFHRIMQTLTAPLLPQVALLVPKTELGRCNAAVSFWSLMLVVLLPALLLVQPNAGSRVAGNRGSWVDNQIEAGLRTLRYSREPSVVMWRWLLLVVLWICTVTLS